MRTKYFYLLFSIILLIALVNAINNAIPSIYFLINPSYTKGVIKEVKQRNSIGADLSFDYLIEYFVKDKSYQLIHTKSITPEGYQIGDTVLVKFSNSNPKYSTAQRDWHQYQSLFFVFIIFLSLIFTAIRSIPNK